MLVHICCSVDSDYFLKQLLLSYANDEIIAYFYDPNIHPYSEYLLRLSDVKRSCKKLGIKLLSGEYDYELWLNGTKGLENEPEKGNRCSYCFDFRLENTAKMAVKLGQTCITTTLLMSPKKEFQTLEKSLDKICKKYDLEFITPDFRKNGGTNKQFQNAKTQKLYHQNYCGCFFALNASREFANLVELSCAISRQIQPASSQERIRLYKKIRKYEKLNKNYILAQVKIQNFRLKTAKVLQNNQAINSYFLFASMLNKKYSKFQITQNSHLYYARDNICLIDLKFFNELANTNYTSTKELSFCATNLKTELKIRKKLCGYLSINPIIVLDEIIPASMQIFLDSCSFESTKEILHAIKE